MCTKKTIYYTVFIFFILVIPIIFYIILIVGSPGYPFADREIEELKTSFNSTPLVYLKNLKDNVRNEFPLFGEYKGLAGGHKYSNCITTFEGTCKSDKGRRVYCPNTLGEEEPQEVDYDSCIDFPQVNPFNYDHLKGIYFYAEKLSQDKYSYEKLKKFSVKKGENCPINKKQCGYLNEDLILCFNIGETCPINDIIINNQTDYSVGNIKYNKIRFIDDKYIHFTNEKTDNQILFDLLFSIEHPLSQIETSEKDYDKIFYLHYREIESYYSGNIDNIKAYKQFYNTGVTLKEFLTSIGKFETFKNMPLYKTKYFDSNIFIYKKFPVPISLPIEECEEVANKFKNVVTLNFFMGFLLILVGFAYCVILTKKSNLARIIGYIIITAIDALIIYLFTINLTVVAKPGILINLEEKNSARKGLLAFRIIFLIYAFLQNILVILDWIFYCKQQKENKENENSDSNENGESPLFDKAQENY